MKMCSCMIVGPTSLGSTAPVTVRIFPARFGMEGARARIDPPVDAPRIAAAALSSRRVLKRFMGRILLGCLWRHRRREREDPFRVLHQHRLDLGFAHTQPLQVWNEPLEHEG